MQWTDIPRNPSSRMLRQFGGLLAACAGASAVWRALSGASWTIPAVIAVSAVLLTAMWPRALRLLFVGWMMAVFPIGWVVSRIVLAALFFGLFTPLGLLFRWTGRDALRLRARHGSTHWSARKPPPPVARYYRQY